ncbi:MAG: carbohydrate ABC transporter permease [Petrotogales bacterium]
MAHKKYSKKYWRETFQAYLFLLPSFVVLGIFIFWPIGFSLVLSFFKWDYTSADRYFIGLDNYKELFRLSYPISLNFIYSVVNTIAYILGAIILTRFIYFIASLFTKYYKPSKEFLPAYSIAIATWFAMIVSKNIYPETVFSWFHFIVALIFIAISAGILLKKSNDEHLNIMKSRNWTTIILVIFFFILSFLFLVPIGDDLITYFTLAKESSDFIKATYNTIYYVLLAVPSQIAIALVVALLLNKKIKLRSLFRTAYFIPFVTSVVAVSLVWQWMFNDQFGLINYFLSWFGIDKIAWLKEEQWTIPTIAIVSVWQHLGYTAVIFLAGLQSIDRSYYEAARVDGANSWQQFKHITWPLLSPTTFFVLIITMIGSFKVFSQIFILYQGLPGPVNQSGLTLVYYVFEKFYNEQRMGVASAGAYILFLIILALTFIQFKIGRKRIHYES